MALDTANIIPVSIPPRAAGITTRLVVCHLEAPMPYEASRNESGTALSASRVATIIIGRINRARVSTKTAFFYLGNLIEFDDTKKIFTNPQQERTQNYVTGRFG